MAAGVARTLRRECHLVLFPCRLCIQGVFDVILSAVLTVFGIKFHHNSAGAADSAFPSKQPQEFV